MNSQIKRYKEQGLKGSQVQELLSPWNWGIPSPSPSMWMCSLTQELPKPCSLGLFIQALFCRHN